MAKKAIKCSKMFDSTTSTVKENVVIFTEGDKITAVVPMAEAKYEDCEVIDLTGKFVITSLERTDPAGDDATYSVSLENDGEVTIAEGALTEAAPAGSQS